MNCDPKAARLDEYSYKIFLQGKKNTGIDEYQIINGEPVFFRKIKPTGVTH